MTSPLGTRQKISDRDFENLIGRIVGLEKDRENIKAVLSFEYYTITDEEKEKAKMSEEDKQTINQMKLILASKTSILFYIEQVEMKVNEAFNLEGNMNLWLQEVLFFKYLFNIQYLCILFDKTYDVLIPLMMNMKLTIEKLEKAIVAAIAQAEAEAAAAAEAGIVIKPPVQGILSKLRDFFNKEIVEKIPVIKEIVSPILDFVI
jgi:hypothetical protein